MTSFFEKATIFAKGTAHDILDRAIDANNPTMLRQYVRELEAALKNQQSEIVVAGGNVRTTARELGDIQHRLDFETNAAKTALAANPPNTALARAHGSSAVTLQADLTAKTQEVESAKVVVTTLENALAKMDAKHTEMVSAVRRLESMDRQTKIKNQSAKAMESVASVSAMGSDISIDNIQAKMQRQADVADERFDRALQDPSFAENPDHAADVDSFLANLK